MSTATHEPAAKAEPHVYGPPVAVVVNIQVTALAFEEADGGYSIVVPELPGVVSEADAIEDVARNAAEACAGWTAVVHARNRDQVIRDVTEPFPSEVGG